MYPYICVSLAQQAVKLCTEHKPQSEVKQTGANGLPVLHRSVYCSKCAYRNWKMYHVETKDYQCIKYGRSLWPFSQHIGYSVATVVPIPFNIFCKLNALYKLYGVHRTTTGPISEYFIKKTIILFSISEFRKQQRKWNSVRTLANMQISDRLHRCASTAGTSVHHSILYSTPLFN
jgi:hypothetical protein